MRCQVLSNPNVPENAAVSHKYHPGQSKSLLHFPDLVLEGEGFPGVAFKNLDRYGDAFPSAKQAHLDLELISPSLLAVASLGKTPDWAKLYGLYGAEYAFDTGITITANQWFYAALVTNALGMAIQNRDPDGTIIHSDQGAQFTSWAFTRRAIDSGLLPSMGSVGSCYDNAMIESFWSRMQVELLDRRSWRTRVELANAIFEYLEIFHNRQRRHSALGMLTPVEFETRHQTETVA